MAYLNYIHWLKKREAVERIPQSGPTTTATKKKKKKPKQTTEIFKVFNLSGFLACWLCSVPHVMDLEWLAVGHVQGYISTKYMLYMYLYIHIYNVYYVHITYTPSLTWQQQAGRPWPTDFATRNQTRTWHLTPPYLLSRVATCAAHVSWKPQGCESWKLQWHFKFTDYDKVS